MTTQTVKKVHGITLQKRAFIAPSKVACVKTPLQRSEVIKAARKVISTHRDVLIALKDR
ncbi:hypothetical protein [Comamonas aquatica]|uniref:hypothetical protein n=1 Tax=Comamonas aquatica TaxID=225991 RepID=UPI003D062160